MTDLQAKPVIENKFWIVEKDGSRYATLRKDEENRFVMSNATGIKIFKNKESVTKQFGKDFFIAKIIKEADNSPTNEVHGYATSVEPHNAMFDIKRRLPLFTKSSDSKSLYCAGHYIIKFDKGWVKSFCPKFITLDRYEYRGPYKSDNDLKQALTNVSR